MPASRLSAGQRVEMVERFRQGVATVVLANAYGCSPNTVSRLVKAALDGAEYERLKRQRQRGVGAADSGSSGIEQPLDLAVPPPPAAVEGDPAGSPPPLVAEGEADAAAVAAAEVAVDVNAAAELAVADATAAVATPVAATAPVTIPAPATFEQPQQVSLPGLLEASLGSTAAAAAGSSLATAPLSRSQPLADAASLPSVSAPAASVASTSGAAAPQQSFLDDQEQERGVLAIEDADDFSDDDDDLSDDDPDDGDDSPAQAGVFLAISPLDIGLAPSPVGALAWGSASLPSSAYMLVEKSVELQPQALRELPELGLLPEEEQQRQALVLYVNPRQAKRLCGRNQRVIRIPDTQVFELTAPKLAAQGITRVVVEGSLFALPGC